MGIRQEIEKALRGISRTPKRVEDPVEEEILRLCQEINYRQGCLIQIAKPFVIPFAQKFQESGAIDVLNELSERMILYKTIWPEQKALARPYTSFDVRVNDYQLLFYGVGLEIRKLGNYTSRFKGDVEYFREVNGRLDDVVEEAIASPKVTVERVSSSLTWDQGYGTLGTFRPLIRYNRDHFLAFYKQLTFVLSHSERDWLLELFYNRDNSIKFGELGRFVDDPAYIKNYWGLRLLPGETIASFSEDQWDKGQLERTVGEAYDEFFVWKPGS